MDERCQAPTSIDVVVQKPHIVLKVPDGLVALELVLEERPGDTVAHHLKRHGHTREEVQK
jgi:hypothetical protein